jgi:hypothetical protein
MTATLAATVAVPAVIVVFITMEPLADISPESFAPSVDWTDGPRFACCIK